MPVNAKDFSLVDAKEHTLTHRSIDAANYIGPIDMDTMMASYEEAFERFVFKNGEKVSFEDFIAHGENLDTIVMTAHPTFFKSKEEADVEEPAKNCGCDGAEPGSTRIAAASGRSRTFTCLEVDVVTTLSFDKASNSYVNNCSKRSKYIGYSLH